MNKITSFTIDHKKLRPGLYVSRKDHVGAETITTFDLRITTPNQVPAMESSAMHAIEHLAATYLRNDPVWKDAILYFGPMGCRTGFYLLMAGDLAPEMILPLAIRCFRYISKYNGKIPGASETECGNYLDMNLPMARLWASRYLFVLEFIEDDEMQYPK